MSHFRKPRLNRRESRSFFKRSRHDKFWKNRLPLPAMNNPIKDVPEEQFISEIRNAIRNGFRVTPFLGSGVSAQSGIIMGEEFPQYLAWTVYQVLYAKWDIRTRGWPPFPSSDEKDESHEKLLKLYLDWCDARNIEYRLSADQDRKKITSLNVPEQTAHQQQLGARDIHLTRPLVPEILRDPLIWDKEEFLDSARRNLHIEDLPSDPNTPDSSEEYIQEMALRALSHWTRTLEFLARVAITDAPHRRLYLEELDISVIDGFNAHITRGKRPNLIHNMVSRLSRSLRAQIILTTNFDTLIEQSYRAQGEPLHMLAVSIKGGLPAFATVRAQDCVVKLHGDILETRADTSINEPPSQVDKERFFQYLRGPKEPHEVQPWDFIPSHLLVLGYSAGDARCVQMIRFVLDMDESFRVFWVCHTPGDLRRVSRIFGSYGDRICVVLTDRADLLLWELYQKVNLSLPGGGYSLQFSHQVPPRSVLFDPRKAAESTEIKDLYKLIRKSSEKNIVHIDCTTGTTQPLQTIFNLFKSDRNNTAWFELEDYRNTDDLFVNLLSFISLNLGYFQLEWINFVTQRDEFEGSPNIGRMLIPNMERRLKLLVEKFKINPERWVFFFYGRNGPGGCTGWADGGNYWQPEAEGETARFHELLTLLRQLHFKIVYLPRGPKREKHDNDKLNQLKAIEPSLVNLQKKMLLPPKAHKPLPAMDDLTHSPELRKVADNWHQQGIDKGLPKSPKFEDIIRTTLDVFGKTTDPKNSSRALWLYGLTLFRQSRHPAAMISEAVFPCPWRFSDNSSKQPSLKGYPDTRDNDEFRNHLIYEGAKDTDTDQLGWLHFLEQKGLFLRKPGGYAWMFRDTRIGLQRILETRKQILLWPAPYATTKSNGLERPLDNFGHIRARLHYWIGDWYLRAFYATGHFIPLTEAIYHSVQAIHHAPNYKWKEDVDESRISLTWKAVCQLRKLLLVGRRSLLFWCPGVDVQQIFFEADLSMIEKGIKKVIKRRASKALRAKLNSAILALNNDIKHLKSAIMKEVYAHGGRTCPINSTGATQDEELKPQQQIQSEIQPPLQTWREIEPVDGLWLKDIFAKINAITCDYMPKADLKTKDSLEEIWIAEPKDAPKLIASLRHHWMSSWATHSGKEAHLFQMIWLISELMYRILRRAKLEYHHKSLLNKTLLLSANKAKVSAHWQMISALGYEALQMCRSLSPEYHQADCDLRVRVLTLYATALGYLNRFSEANRRLNEAHAVILSGMGWPDGRELARIHIRRAEMLIWRARSTIEGYSQTASTKDTDTEETLKKHKEDKETQLRLSISWLDDAWAALERGELCLGGVSHSTYWWYRLLSSKLSAYATLAAIVKESGEGNKAASSLLFRRRIHLPSTLVGLVRDALIVGAGDIFRQIRVLEYAFYIDEHLNKDDPDQVFKHRPKGDGPFTPRTHPQLYQDIVRVMNFFPIKDKNGQKEEPPTMLNACLMALRDKWEKFTEGPKTKD